ncbi:glycosyltransferase family 2 protein [Nonlabens ponticola]|uniref:Glycosyltransferase family 2 protein n=1 Tax=Nonlabens ponticola TaxID=2496866 RepID=A0A3S9MX11_9FLAO|nr:glycosyltransferase family 2 protein [Nonlabens ponticola]AZQ43684.1 glycosyltransferase family 2 protein [Nonlabens ponticola]
MDILVVIPVYNKASTLQRAVESAVNQTYAAREVLIIDDGSNDGSERIADQLVNEKIRVIHQNNQGVSAARNAGIAYAQENDFTQIALLDADDYWTNEHLATIKELFEKFPTAQVFATNYLLKRKRKTLETKFSNLKNSEPQVLLEPFFKYNYLNPTLRCSSIVIETSALEKVGLFNTDYTHFEDIDWFIRIGIHLKIAFSKKITLYVDESAENRSNKVAMSQRRYPDFSDYDDYASTNNALSKYLSLNRYGIAIAYRLVNDISGAHKYQNIVDVNHLTKKQQSLLKMNRIQLKSLRKTQRILGNLGFHVRSGK